MLCDEELNYCETNPGTCENGGNCTSLIVADGNYKCRCPTGYRGKNCHIEPTTTTTSTTTELVITTLGNFNDNDTLADSDEDYTSAEDVNNVD